VENKLFDVALALMGILVIFAGAFAWYEDTLFKEIWTPLCIFGGIGCLWMSIPNLKKPQIIFKESLTKKEAVIYQWSNFLFLLLAFIAVYIGYSITGAIFFFMVGIITTIYSLRVTERL
jgi:hypothetical protein